MWHYIITVMSKETDENKLWKIHFKTTEIEKKKKNWIINTPMLIFLGLLKTVLIVYQCSFGKK